MKPQGARHEIILKNALRRFMLPLTQASQAESRGIAPEWGDGALSSRIRGADISPDAFLYIIP